MSKFRKSNTRSAKLTGEQVLELRQRYIAGATQGELARAYGISIGQIGRIVRGESWQDKAQVEDPQPIRDAAAESLARLRAMQEHPLPSEEQEALERGQKLLERMGQEVNDKHQTEQELEEFKGTPLTKPNPYF